MKINFLFTCLFTLLVRVCFANPTDDGTGVPKIVINPHGHSGKISSLHYTPDGEKIISVSEDKSIKVWDAETGQLLKNFYCQIGDGPEGMLYASAISPDGKLLAAGGYPVPGIEGNYIVLIDLESGKQVGLGTGHTNVINTLDFSHDGEYLASGSDDGTIIIWKIEQGNTLIRISSVGSAGLRVSSISFAANSMKLAVASGKKEVLLYDFSAPSRGKTGYPNINLIKHKGIVKYVKHSPDGRYIASCDDNKTVVLWSSKGEFISQIEGFSNEVNTLTFSDDGKILVTLNDADGIGSSYSIPECNKFTSFNGHKNSALSVDFSPKSIDGNYQVASSGGGNNEILIWNAINGKQLKSIKGKGNPVSGLKYVGENQLVISQSHGNDKDEHLLSFNLATFQIGRIPGKSAISPAGAKTKGAYQKDIYQIQLAGGKAVINDPAVDGRVLVFENLANGSVVVGSDFSLKIYDHNAHLSKEFIGHTGSIRALAISEDGHFLASGGEDQTINIWKLDAEGNVPSMWEVYDDFDYREFFKAYGLDSIAKVNKKEAWLAAIDFLANAKEKVYREFQKALADLGEQIQPIATLFIADDDEWICYTPEGYFTCSSTGGQYFIWEVNRGFHSLADYYSAEQYFDILFRPDLLKETLRTGKSATEILREKGERIFDLTKLNRPSAGLFDAPLLASGQTRGIEQKRSAFQTESRRVKLMLEVFDGGGGVKEVNIYQNNKLILIDDKIKLINQEKTKREYEVDLMNGVNDFKVVVLNYQNIESRPDHIVVEYIGEIIATSDLYVFSVGINDYKNPAYNLNYAQPDAAAFTRKIMERSKRMFKDVHVYELYNDKAQKESIVDTFNKIVASAKPQDVFVFYYAGHGSIETDDPNAEYYLVPHDVTKLYGDNQMLNEKGIPASELKNLLSTVKSQKQLILLDACHSGGAAKSLLTRSAASEEKAIFQLARSTGVVLIAASGTQQFATEFEALKHGVFTYALLEALDGKGNTGRDQRITVNELKAYMEDRVPELSMQYGGKAQYPTGFSNGQDFPISLIVE